MFGRRFDSAHLHLFRGLCPLFCFLGEVEPDAEAVEGVDQVEAILYYIDEGVGGVGAPARVTAHITMEEMLTPIQKNHCSI